MKIIIDSGSTKADWRIVQGANIGNAETIGLSPVLHSKEFIEKTINELVASSDAVGIQAKQVYYYGTGCWDEARKKIIANALAKVFSKAEIIKVENDLFGAARAACGFESGIVAILGTGSNSCLFDGQAITDQVENLGYILGDEGSGGDLGKRLLQAYFYKELPAKISSEVDKYFPEGKTTLLDKLYGTDRPNAYLASFTKLIAAHQVHPFIQNLLETSFSSFIDRHLVKYNHYQSLPVHFVGSIAFYFQPIIKKLLLERNMQMGRVIKKPIDYLVKFHIDHE